MKHLVGLLLGFRKFTVVVVFLLLTAGYCYLTLITGTEFLAAAKEIVYIYIAGNIGEHTIKLGADYVSNKKNKD